MRGRLVSRGKGSRPITSCTTSPIFPLRSLRFYEHRVPEGQKAYSMTRPIRLEHLQDCIDWWGGTERTGRQETERAWKVTAVEVKARGYNLDINNPHTQEDELGDPQELVVKLAETEAEVTALRAQLKAMLAKALLRSRPLG